MVVVVVVEVGGDSGDSGGWTWSGRTQNVSIECCECNSPVWSWC